MQTHTEPYTARTVREHRNKTGTTVIRKGESVTVRFDVKLKGGGIAQTHCSLNTQDGRRITLRPQNSGLFKVPKLRELDDSVVESVFGEQVEPDGIDEQGSPSWLLVLGLI